MGAFPGFCYFACSKKTVGFMPKHWPQKQDRKKKIPGGINRRNRLNPLAGIRLSLKFSEKRVGLGLIKCFAIQSILNSPGLFSRNMEDRPLGAAMWGFSFPGKKNFNSLTSKFQIT